MSAEGIHLAPQSPLLSLSLLTEIALSCKRDYSRVNWIVCVTVCGWKWNVLNKNEKEGEKAM